MDVNFSFFFTIPDLQYILLPGINSFEIAYFVMGFWGLFLLFEEN